MLLDYHSLRKKFESDSPKGRLTVFLYSKDGDAVTIHSKQATKKHSDTLASFIPGGLVGELFHSENEFYVCIGKRVCNPVVERTNVCQAMKALSTNLKRFHAHEVQFADSEFADDAIFGLIITGYSYDFLKSQKETTAIKLATEPHRRTVEIAHGQNIARFLGDTPANLMTPTLFSKYAESLTDGLDSVTFECYGKEFLQKNQMNLILSVSQGSVEEPRLLRILYQGRADDGVDVSLVGKGVCFDSGGVSLKPGLDMHRMKRDMMGAATVLNTLRLASILQLKINMTATIPLVENMPSGSATKPGDVFKSMSGVTVQVDNTDAEGRLILADALTFAQRDRPKYLFDVATLTGAMSIALGKVYAGFFTEDDALANKIHAAGLQANDLFWRMPLSPFYRDHLKSPVADINNIGGRAGGSCIAAEFLKEFVTTDSCKWAHFDIAGVSDESHVPEIFGSEATGRPIRGFISLIEAILQ